MTIANYLFNKNIIIKTYDPQAMSNAKIILPMLNYCDSIKDACENVDALIISTEWNEFRALDFKELKKKMNRAIIFDLRNIYNKVVLLELGFEYYGIGK
jgi:UDPglucose 6-dehydrogenase